MSTRVNIEKARMDFAFDNSKDAPDPKKYESYVNKVPALIHTNGLGNTIAYIASQSDKNWLKVGENIYDWLNSDKSVFKGELDKILTELEQKREKAKKDKDNNLKIIALLKKLQEPKNDQIIKACTIETSSLFNWLRHFAKINKD